MSAVGKSQPGKKDNSSSSSDSSSDEEKNVPKVKFQFFDMIPYFKQ